jgi:hypothetical protein
VNLWQNQDFDLRVIGGFQSETCVLQGQPFLEKRDKRERDVLLDAALYIFSFLSLNLSF